MATPVLMPKVGISVESCVLTKWHKKTGDKVNKGDLLFTYETDKTTVDEEAPESGTLLTVFFSEGDDVPVMQNVCVIGNGGEDFSQFAPASAKAEEPVKAASVPAAPAAPAPAAETKTAAPAPAAATVIASGRLKISPRAKVLASKTGVDPLSAIPTGAEGRITESDIAALASSATGAMANKAASGVYGTGLGGRVSTFDTASAKKQEGPEFVDEKISSVRKFIAKAMHESISTMAQLTHNSSFDATDILNFRKYLKENGEKLGLPNITVNDIVLYAVSRTLMKHKYVNAHFLGDTMRCFNCANIGMAVDTERGLLVPTLFNADTMTLAQISASAKDLAKKSQAGTISPDLIKGGTFTVSNLGAFGIETFTPIVNPPQVAILGVNTMRDEVKMENGQLKLYKRMSLSLTYDHRAIDGAPASRFLKDVCDFLENFTTNLALESMLKK